MWRRCRIFNKHLQLSPVQNDIPSVLMNTSPLHSACTHLVELAPLAQPALRKHTSQMVNVWRLKNLCEWVGAIWKKGNFWLVCNAIELQMATAVRNTRDILFLVMGAFWVPYEEGSFVHNQFKRAMPKCCQWLRAYYILRGTLKSLFHHMGVRNFLPRTVQ